MEIPDIKNDTILIHVLDELKFRLSTKDATAHLTNEFDILLNEFILKHKLDFDPNNFATDPNRYINKFVKNAAILEVNALYAGIALMCKSLWATGYVDDSGLHKIIAECFAIDRENNTSPFWTRDILADFKISYSYDKLEVNLLNQNIINDWTVIPGKLIFEKLIVKFIKELSNKDGPYSKGLFDPNLPVAIVSAILATGISTFWIPLLVYLALLLIKTGFKPEGVV